MTVDPISISAGIANLTSALPFIQDALTYGANWIVQNTIGAVAICMIVVGFGVKMAIGLIRGRKRR